MARILVIEDDRTLRKVYVTILTKEGFEVSAAVDGEEGLALAQKLEPDLILLDMMMPKMSGLDFLRAYELKEKHPKVKVIAFSATEKEEFVVEAPKLGASKYLTKFRFSPKAMVQIVRETLADGT
jgi:two-component system response regulator VicR